MAVIRITLALSLSHPLTIQPPFFLLQPLDQWYKVKNRYVAFPLPVHSLVLGHGIASGTIVDTSFSARFRHAGSEFLLVVRQVTGLDVFDERIHLKRVTGHLLRQLVGSMPFPLAVNTITQP